ncbi:MAG: DNA repair protein RecO [Candidatus Nealsonbacteria bacterium]
MFVHHRTKGIIFRKLNRKEADQLFSIYTKDFGRLEILARAIRKTTSKLRAGIEIFYLSEIEFIQGKNYKTLTDAIVIEKFKNLRKDLKRIDIVYNIGEVLDDLIKGQEPDESIWSLLLEVFEKLNDNNFKNIEIIYYYFLWKFLSVLGYKPNLYNCLACEKKLKPESIYFSPKKQGIICKNCFSKDKLDILVSPATIKIIRFITEKELKTISRLKINDKELKGLEEFSKHYLSFILEISGQI